MVRINHDAIKGREFALTHNWDLIVEALPSAVASLPEARNIIGSTGILNLHCETSALPASTLVMGEGKIRGMPFRQPMSLDPEGNISLSFFERKDHQIFAFFEAWKELGFNKLSGVQTAKGECVLAAGFKLKLRDGSASDPAAYQGQYELLQVIPESVANPEVTGEGALWIVQVTINYTTYKYNSLINF